MLFKGPRGLFKGPRGLFKGPQVSDSADLSKRVQLTATNKSREHDRGDQWSLIFFYEGCQSAQFKHATSVPIAPEVAQVLQGSPAAD